MKRQNGEHVVSSELVRSFNATRRYPTRPDTRHVRVYDYSNSHHILRKVGR